MSDYVIEKNVPYPANRQGLGFPLSEMEVGDSFEAPIDKMPSVRNAASRYGMKTEPKAKFVVRKVSDTKCRIWRIE